MSDEERGTGQEFGGEEARAKRVLAEISSRAWEHPADRAALQALRKILDYDPQAKVIMCSALGQQSLIVQALQLGAKDFIVKPFREERVISAIKKILDIE